MENRYDLSRFVKAQRLSYDTALEKIRRGRKRSCWMWFVFPQLKQLGRSDTSRFYGIDGLDEARAYYADPLLGGRLREITEALLQLDSDDPSDVMGYPDDMKLRSSMTLFEAAAPECPLFSAVLEKYFSGNRDMRTLKLLGL